MAGALAYGTLEVIARLVQASAMFLLAAWSSKASFGAFYSYFGVSQLVSVMATGGLVEAFMSRRVSIPVASSDELAEYLVRYLRRSLWCVVFLYPGLKVSAYALQIKAEDGPLILALLGGLCYGAVTTLAALFTCLGRNQKSILLRGGYLILSYSCGLLLAAHLGTDGFLLGTAMVGSLTFVFGLIAWKDLRHALLLSARLLPSVRGSVWFIIPTLLNWFLWYGVVLATTAYFGAEKAAELAFVNNIVSMLLIVNSAITQTWLASYLRHASRSRVDAELRSKQVYRIQSVLILLVAIVTVLIYEGAGSVGQHLVVKYSGLGMELAVMLLALSISSPYFSAVNAYAVSGAGRALATISLGVYLLSTLFLIALVMSFGLFGIYLGLAALIICRGFAITSYAMRKLDAGFVDPRLIGLNIIAAIGIIFLYSTR